MKVRLKDRMLVVSAETEEEQLSVQSWAASMECHAFVLIAQDAQTFRLTDLGPRSEACREPINVTSLSPDPEIQLISNFAHTPFELDGLPYASVEAFWQGLKFPKETDRKRIASLYGQEARKAGSGAPEASNILYGGQSIPVGTSAHWRLMSLACWAKFTQNEEAQAALLNTGQRPLLHRTRKDSRTIPGVIMADIWMKVRRGLNKSAADDEAAMDEGF